MAPGKGHSHTFLIPSLSKDAQAALQPDTYYGSSTPPACSGAGGVVGGLAGAAGGGLLGNQIGHGTGKEVATGVGVVGGGAAGYAAGRSLSGC